MPINGHPLSQEKKQGLEQYVTLCATCVVISEPGQGLRQGTEAACLAGLNHWIKGCVPEPKLCWSQQVSHQCPSVSWKLAWNSFWKEGKREREDQVQTAVSKQQWNWKKTIYVCGWDCISMWNKWEDWQINLSRIAMCLFRRDARPRRPCDELDRLTGVPVSFGNCQLDFTVPSLVTDCMRSSGSRRS